MSNKASDNLTGEKIQQLLSAVGSAPAEDNSQIEAKEHNWSEPHYFSNEQLEKLGSFTENVASAIAKKFTDFCRGQFEVAIVSTKQYFANDFINQSSDDEQELFYLPFDGGNGHKFGLLGMPEKTAITWIKKLLGDTESQEDTEKELPQLEKSLLLDLASALVQVFSQSHSSFNLHPANSLATKQWPLDIEGTEELCQISFSVKQTDTENSTEAYFLIPCSKLEPVSGTTKKEISELSQENMSQMIIEHLKQTSVCVTVQLATVELSFEEMMDLQVNDILLLERKVSDSVELIMDGRTVCYGWPVQSAGKYAVAISSTTFGDST